MLEEQKEKPKMALDGSPQSTIDQSRLTAGQTILVPTAATWSPREKLINSQGEDRSNRTDRVTESVPGSG